MIKEVIVVEGRDDVAAVKRALDVEVVATGGFGYSKELLRTIKSLADRNGIIILTDPDYAGEQIRKDLARRIPNCKHAFLPQGKALKKDNIGIENASPEDIREAIAKARPENIDREIVFTRDDLLMMGLIGGSGSREKREKLGALLGIGYSNGKQLLNRLNNFGISRDEFQEAIERIEKENER